MEAVDRLASLARQFAGGVMSENEFRQEALEVIVADRAEILHAERTGTLVTL